MFRLLIAEDETIILNYIKRLAANSGEFQVVGAYDVPEEALANFEVLLPEVVFLDMEMPRMGGMELARKMRSINPELRIVFITAYSQYAVKAFEVEAVDYLLKPITLEDLQRVEARLKKLIPEPREETAAVESHSKLLPAGVPPIKCLGCFEVRDSRGEMVRWPTKKSEEVFAYLFLHQNTYVSKWSLLDIFWPGIEEEKGLNNLYATVSRVKKILRTLSCNPQVKMLNAGYMLMVEPGFSDLERIRELLASESSAGEDDTALQMENAFFSYKYPLFGMKDYLWSIYYQESVSEYVRRMYLYLMRYYKQKEDSEKMDKLIRHFALQHIEEEEMLREGLISLSSFEEGKGRIKSLELWINGRLEEQELPLIYYTGE